MRNNGGRSKTKRPEPEGNGEEEEEEEDGASQELRCGPHFSVSNTSSPFQLFYTYPCFLDYLPFCHYYVTFDV